MVIANSERADSSVSGSRMMHGGYSGARLLSVRQRDRLDALIDTLIPPEDGWPSSSTLTVADVLARYLAPDDGVVIHYPGFTFDQFGQLLERVGTPLLSKELEGRVTHLKQFELDEYATFARLRDFVYYCYYGSPDVVELIRTRSRFGSDFHGRPQPTGYDQVLETWGQRTLTGRGAFFPTDAVRRVVSTTEEPS